PPPSSPLLPYTTLFRSAPEHSWNLIASGAQAPTEEIVASGLEAAKPFIKQLVAAQAELAKEAAKPVAEFPIFLDFQDDVYAAVRSEEHTSELQSRENLV